MIVFLLLLALLPDESQVLGIYDCDKKALLLDMATSLAKSNGKLSKPQMKLIEDEVNAAELRIVLAKKGRANFVVNLGMNRRLDGNGIWKLQGEVFSLTITHKYGLRLEKLRKVSGTWREGKLVLKLTGDLPELLFVKKAEKKEDKL